MQNCGAFTRITPVAGPLVVGVNVTLKDCGAANGNFVDPTSENWGARDISISISLVDPVGVMVNERVPPKPTPTTPKSSERGFSVKLNGVMDKAVVENEL